MTRLRTMQALVPAIAFAMSGAASAAIRMDGRLPVYPNAVPRGFTWSMPKIDQALKVGFQILADSTDPVATVADWYQRHLPKSCTKESNGAAVGFHCAQSAVGIRTQHGKTFLILSP